MVLPLVIAGAGLAISAYGAFSGAQASSKYAAEASAAQQQISAYERQVEAQRRQQMELTGRRQQMELFRNAQRTRALALTTATSQGASQGSGLQGGYGQISGDAYTNLLGINQNLSIGRNIFDINNLISGQKDKLTQAQASYQTSSSTAQGFSQLGGSLMSAGMGSANLFGGFTGPANSGFGMGNFMAPGSSSFNSKGYP